MTTTINWKRSRTGIYTSDCGRWSICQIEKGKWRLADMQIGGRCRYYHSLTAAKNGAVYHAQD